MTINRKLAALFSDFFEKELQKGLPHWEAYEQAERRFEKVYQTRKYSSFDSFRITRGRKIRKKRNNVSPVIQNH